MTVYEVTTKNGMVLYVDSAEWENGNANGVYSAWWKNFDWARIHKWHISKGSEGNRILRLLERIQP